MSKRIKYLEINLIKEVKCLYTEGNKTLMEQIGKDTNKKTEPPGKWYDDGTKQKHISAEQDRKPRNKPIYL